MSSLPLVLFASALALVHASGATRAAADTSSAVDCLDQLDKAVLLARDGDPITAGTLLERLRAPCPHLSQIHHNLGVIAEQADDTAAALVHFEAALAVDPRTASTLRTLRELHRRDAAAAYARALGTAQHRPAPLALEWQDAGDTRATPRDQSESDLRHYATLEYELYDWWVNANVDSADAWLEHYSDDYPATLALKQHGRARPVAWESVLRELAFTEQDAVAIIDHGKAGARERRLLLLRLQGNRWKIYQESPL